MKPITWNEEGVRAECLHCGAHTKFDWEDYESSIEEGRSVWCSTCASFQLLKPRSERIRRVMPAVPELALRA
jgi:DNA-directed RNA polymerase subunit RPC12/RpoP